MPQAPPYGEHTGHRRSGAHQLLHAALQRLSQIVAPLARVGLCKRLVSPLRLKFEQPVPWIIEALCGNLLVCGHLLHGGHAHEQLEPILKRDLLDLLARRLLELVDDPHARPHERQSCFACGEVVVDETHISHHVEKLRDRHVGGINAALCRSVVAAGCVRLKDGVE
eukprot:7384437-Prymnesium_polylepis.2